MRNPIDPSDPEEPVCIYGGVYPNMGADSFALYYRINGGTWSMQDFAFTCNDGPNDYWWSSCDDEFSWWLPGAAYGDLVEYYIMVTKAGYMTTYLYDETSPTRTTTEATAQGNPYYFVYEIPPTATPVPPTFTPVPPTDTPVPPTNTPTPVPPSPTPELTPTPAATEPPECINSGDVNGDNDVTAGDAQLAFEIALGMWTPTYVQACGADCNGSGDVTSGDAQMIFFRALGMGACADPLPGNELGDSKELAVVENNSEGTLKLSGSNEDGKYLVMLDVSLDNEPVKAFTVTISFCEEQMEYVGVATGTINPNWIMFGANETAPGELTIGGFTLNEIPDGTSGSLAVMEFRPIGSATGKACELALIKKADDVRSFQIGH